MAPAQHVPTYFKELHARYGGLVYLNLNGTVSLLSHLLSQNEPFFTQPTYVISDLPLAKELLEKRSAHTASRPVLPFHVGLMKHVASRPVILNILAIETIRRPRG
jgi:hypothetical protein